MIMFAVLVRHGGIWSFYSPSIVQNFQKKKEAEEWISKVHSSLRPFLFEEDLILYANEPSRRIKRLYNLYRMMQKHLLLSETIITSWELFLFDELFHILYEEFNYTF